MIASHGCARRRDRDRGRDERGVVGGGDGLVFGMLVLVAGTLLVVNAWAVIDLRLTLDDGAREYLRSYTESDDIASARAAGESAARTTMAARRRSLPEVRISADEPVGFGPCAPVGVELAATAPWVRIPFVGSFGDIRVSVVGRELVDAHREMTTSPGFEPTSTPCGGG